MSEPLKPCPFCGAAPIRESQWLITCQTCGIEMIQRIGHMSGSCVAAWNTRHQPEPTPEHLERVARVICEYDYQDDESTQDQRWNRESGFYETVAEACIKAMKARP